MLEEQEQWQKEVVCRFCDTHITATVATVMYGDIRLPFMFVPDYQYYIPCPRCHKNLIVDGIPSRISLAIQTKGTLTP